MKKYQAAILQDEWFHGRMNRLNDSTIHSASHWELMNKDFTVIYEISRKAQ